MMWVMVALASVELLATHVLLSPLWSRTVALLLSLVTFAGVLWLVGVIRSMRRLPVLLDGERLLMWVGTLKGVAVPLADVAGLRPAWEGDDLKQHGVLRLSLIAYPNVVVDLSRPRLGRRGWRTVAHRLDDPVAFAAALERLTARA